MRRVTRPARALAPGTGAGLERLRRASLLEGRRAQAGVKDTAARSVSKHRAGPGRDSLPGRKLGAPAGLFPATAPWTLGAGKPCSDSCAARCIRARGMITSPQLGTPAGVGGGRASRRDYESRHGHTAASAGARAGFGGDAADMEALSSRRRRSRRPIRVSRFSVVLNPRSSGGAPSARKH